MAARAVCEVVVRDDVALAARTRLVIGIFLAVEVAVQRDIERRGP
jgi:hypothetical protein